MACRYIPTDPHTHTDRQANTGFWASLRCLTEVGDRKDGNMLITNREFYLFSPRLVMFSPSSPASFPDKTPPHKATPCSSVFSVEYLFFCLCSVSVFPLLLVSEAEKVSHKVRG